MPFGRVPESQNSRGKVQVRVVDGGSPSGDHAVELVQTISVSNEEVQNAIHLIDTTQNTSQTVLYSTPESALRAGIKFADQKLWPALCKHYNVDLASL